MSPATKHWLQMPVTWFSITLGVIWVILDRKEPFRSHFWLTMLCAGASAVLMFVGFVLVGLIRRRVKRGENSPRSQPSAH
jgi:hypothetical protein